MADAPLQVLYEDNHLLALSKPAGLPTMGVSADKPSLIALARDYIKRKYSKPGNVYLGVVSRIDSPVTGVVLFARTSKAAARLTEQFRDREVEKVYWALVKGRTPRQGEYRDWLADDERHRRMHVAADEEAGAKEARLSFRRLADLGAACWIEVRLHTGRKHQIRLQMAHHGHPVLGDRKYGGPLSFSPGIALHARRLVVRHPTQGTPLELIAPLPSPWRRFGIDEAREAGESPAAE